MHYVNNTSDYQFWCDGDDLLNDKLLETLKKFVNDDSVECDIYYIKYQYYFGDTNPHFRTSILKTATDLSWHDPIHEFIALIPNIKLSYTYSWFNQFTFEQDMDFIKYTLGFDKVYFCIAQNMDLLNTELE